MCEILFRGKEIETGDWVYGHYIDKIDGSKPIIVISASMEDDCSIDFDYDHVDPETVGQFTGLYANGKLIFEGDILKNRRTGKTAVVKAEVWNCGCCHNVFGFSTETTSVDLDSEYSEVIGNIHDNPELLEEGVDNG